MRTRYVCTLVLCLATLACNGNNPFAGQLGRPAENLDLGPVRGDVQTTHAVTIPKPILPPARVQLIGAPQGAIAPEEGQLPATAGNGLEFELRVRVTPGGNQATLEGSFTIRFTSLADDLVSDVDVFLQAEVEVPVGLVAFDLDFGNAPLGRTSFRTLWLDNPNKATPVEVLATAIPEGVFTLEPGHGAGVSQPNARFPILIRFFPLGLGPAAPVVVTVDTAFGPLDVTVSGAGVPPPPPSEEPDPDPEPVTTIYFQTGGNKTAQPVWTMNEDGNDKTFLFTVPEPPVGTQSAHPSYHRHDGERWYLVFGHSSDLSRRELVAITEGGNAVVLWGEDGADVTDGLGNRRWAKDDSFVSFKIARSDDNTSAILRTHLDWSTGVPDPTSTEIVLAGTRLQKHGGATSIASGHDWSPDGMQLVHGDRTANFPQSTLFVKNLGTGRTDFLFDAGGGPVWAPDGSRIAFAPSSGSLFAPGIYTVRPDGSDLVAVRQVAGDFARWPEWSPDSSQLVFQHVNNGAFEILRAPATGGSAVNLTPEFDDELRPVGWRQ